jgi:Flp pilus assembly protein TadG
MTSLRATLRSFSALIAARRMAKDGSGMAAIEFAMVVPIMVSLFIGSVEFSQAITVDRRVTQVASSAADLVARRKEITTAEITNNFLLIEELLRPYDPTQLRVTIANVIADINNETITTVCWSQNHNGGVNTYSAGQTYTLPTGIVEKGGSVIVAEVSYNYSPLIFNYFIESAFPLEERFFLKPRLSSFVRYNGNNCT